MSIILTGQQISLKRFW